MNYKKMEKKIYSIKEIAKLSDVSTDTVIKGILSIFPKWKIEKFIEFRDVLLYRVLENIKKYRKLSQGKLFVIVKDISDHNLIMSVDFMTPDEIEVFRKLIKTNCFTWELVIDDNNPLQYRMYYECYFYNGPVRM
jgi:hypothetical protein